MRRKALFMILSEKAKNNSLLILDSLSLESPAKTKIMKEILDNLFIKKSENQKIRNSETILIVLPEKNENIIRAARNIPKVAIVEARNLNILSSLNYKYLLMPKSTIGVIKETFLKSESVC